MTEKKAKAEGLLDWVSHAWESIYVLITLLASAGLNAVFQWMVTSEIMRSFMTVAAVLGSLLGYGLMLLMWKGASKKKRGWAAVVFVVLTLLCAFVGAFTTWVLHPYTARDYPWAEQIRDLLVAPSYGANAIMSLVAFAGSFCLVSAFALMSPALAKTSTH